MSPLGPQSYEEKKKAQREWDKRRREAARRYEDKRREECDRKYRDLGTNSKRREREFKRAYGSGERVDFVRDMGCCVPGCYAGEAENAHLPGAGGMGHKGDADTVVNLCPAHHRTHPQSLHNLGSCQRFLEVWCVWLPDVAEEVERKWREREAA